MFYAAKSRSITSSRFGSEPDKHGFDFFAETGEIGGQDAGAINGDRRDMAMLNTKTCALFQNGCGCAATTYIVKNDTQHCKNCLYI